IARPLQETGDPALAGHLRTCLDCNMQKHARYFEAPPGLEEKIRDSLRRESVPAQPLAAPWAARWRTLGIAAAALLAISLGANVAFLRSRIDPRQTLAATLLS